MNLQKKKTFIHFTMQHFLCPLRRQVDFPLTEAAAGCRLIKRISFVVLLHNMEC